MRLKVFILCNYLIIIIYIDTEISTLKSKSSVEITALQTENSNLKKLLDQVSDQENEKSCEVKMVRANLIEEVVRVQKQQKHAEDELRQDYDTLMAKYNEAILALQETMRKSEDDKHLLQKRIEDIHNENQKVESDLHYQISQLHRANTKLVKEVESGSQKLSLQEVSV